MDERTNPFVDELKKCIKKQVVVVDCNGKEFKGECRAISFQHLNVVLMTDTEKIIIKNISNIRRTRSIHEKKLVKK